ncbi:MAG: glycosyltransferase family 2 protein [Anaerolineales bacterium]|jgi:glycosyltransferase involved in cell wall biosynthesis
MFSVIIPSYNSAIFLEEAIRSVLAQTYKDYEIIVVDDGSSDDCYGVVQRFGNRVKYIWQENQGLAGARNTGIRASNQQFLALLDADDQWLPNFLETMVELINEQDDAAVYYACAQCMDSDGRDLPRTLGGPAVPPDKFYHRLLRANFLIPSTIVIRRAVAVNAGLFDQTLRSCEDWDLWLRILPEKKFVGTSRCLTRYRLHGNSLSDNLDGMHQSAKAVIIKNFGEDDKNTQTWTADKKQAYGGLYRYQALTLVQRRNDWQTSASYLNQALLADPSTAMDLDFFYDLVYGSYPIGYRGSKQNFGLGKNQVQLMEMLQEVFDNFDQPDSKLIKDQTFGTAYFAAGLHAYNIGEYSLTRQWLINAWRYRPDLWRDSRVSLNYLKSFIKTILE